MSSVHGAAGGFPQREDAGPEIEVEAILDGQDEEKLEELEAIGINTNNLHEPSVYRPLPISNRRLDVIADLTKPAPAGTVPTVGVPREAPRIAP